MANYFLGLKTWIWQHPGITTKNVLLFHKSKHWAAQRDKQPSATGITLIHDQIKIQETAAAWYNRQSKPQPAGMEPCSHFCRSRRDIKKICSLELLAPCIDISDAFRYPCVCATSKEFIFPLFAKINSIPSMKRGRRQGWFKWFHFAIFCVLFKSLIHFSAQYSALSLIRKSLICSEKCKSESCLRALLGICKCVGFCVASKLFLKGFWCLQLASLAPVDPSPSPHSTPVCRAVLCIPSASKKLFLL